VKKEHEKEKKNDSLFLASRVENIEENLGFILHNKKTVKKKARQL